MSESFAQLFEESLKGLETRQGSIVSGTVVAIQKGFVLVDAGWPLMINSALAWDANKTEPQRIVK